MAEQQVGIVGCGLISSAHIKAWQRTPGFVVRGVLDMNRDQADKRAKEFGIATVFSTLDELVAACDVVDVCTPPQSHASIAETALRARRHVVMEKPVVTKLADWERLSALVAESTSRLAVIHNAKFLYGIQLAKRWVDEGRIGQVIRLHREFLTHESTDRMLVGSDHWSHKLPGGRWFETLPHELYLTHWFAGPLDLAGVAAVRTPHCPPATPADEVLVTMSGASCIATFQFSANCRENRRTLTIQGTEGRIVVDMLSDFATISKLGDSKVRRAFGRTIMEAGSTLLRAAPDRGRYGLRRLGRESPHLHIIQALGKNLRGEGDEPTPFAEVDYVIRMGDKIAHLIDLQSRESSVVTSR